MADTSTTTDPLRGLPSLDMSALGPSPFQTAEDAKFSASAGAIRAGPSSHFKEMMRIHELWGESKAQLRQAKRDKESLARAYRREIAELKEKHRAETAELRDRGAVLLHDSTRNKAESDGLAQENKVLREACEDMHRQLRVSQDRLEAQRKTLSEQHARVREMDSTVAELTRAQSVGAAEIEKSQTYREQLAAEKARAEALGSESARAADEARGLRSDIQALREERDRLKSQLRVAAETRRAIVDARVRAALEKQEAAFRRDAAEAEARLSRALQRLEAESSTRRDLEARIRQLKSLPHDVVDISARIDRALGAAGASRRSPPKKSRGSSPARRRPKSPAAAVFPGREDEDLPAEVRDIAERLMARIESGGVSAARPLGGLLRRLNQVWQTNIRTKLARVQRRHQAQVRELRRSAQQRLPYAAVLAKAQIQRLKQEVAKSRSQVARTRADRAAVAETRGLTDLALVTVDSLTNELGAERAKTRRLQRAVEKMTQMAGSGRAEAAFLAGVRWAGDKADRVLGELETGVVAAAANSSEEPLDQLRGLQSDLKAKFSAARSALDAARDNAARAVPVAAGGGGLERDTAGPAGADIDNGQDGRFTGRGLA